MANVGKTFSFVFPVLVVSIAVVLICFYLQTNKKRASFTISTPRSEAGNASSSVYAVPLDEEPGVNSHFDRFPPRYSEVEPPPPYSLFDPKLTNVWPGGPPPAYDLYPITLPLAPHHWMDSASNPTTTRHSEQLPSGVLTRAF